MPRWFIRCRPGLREPEGGCCVRPARPPESPDLAIYSQAHRIALGELPDWDSPDIKTHRWSPWRLFTELPITVRNLSPGAHAVHALVHVELSRFGIGTPRRPLGSRRITVPAASQRELHFALDQASLDAGPRIGVHVTLEHPHDRIAINDAGSQAIDGMRTSEDGRSRTLTIPVVNEAPGPRTISLAVHAEDVTGHLEPISLELEPGEEGTTTLTTQVPSDLHASSGDVRRHVIVIARDSAGAILGGITQIVRVDD